ALSLMWLTACRPTDKSSDDAAGTDQPPPCDCSDVCAECPEQSADIAPRVVVRGEKGEGPASTWYPQLESRPSIEAEHVEALADTLEKLGKKKIPSTPGPGEPGPPTMNVEKEPDDPMEPPVGAPPGYRDRQNMRIAIEPWVTITPQGVATLKWK